jgi:sulfur carrier protein
MINVIVNGDAREFANEISLAALIEKLELPAARIAVELNQTVVRRADWSKIVLQENDRLEIVHFVGGG